jgi:hypothetical protein
MAAVHLATQHMYQTVCMQHAAISICMTILAPAAAAASAAEDSLNMPSCTDSLPCIMWCACLTPLSSPEHAGDACQLCWFLLQHHHDM